MRLCRAWWFYCWQKLSELHKITKQKKYNVLLQINYEFDHAKRLSTFSAYSWCISNKKNRQGYAPTREVHTLCGRRFKSSAVSCTKISVGSRHALKVSCPSCALSLSPNPKIRPRLVMATVWYSPVQIWETWWDFKLSRTRGLNTLSDAPLSGNPRLPKPIQPKPYTEPSSTRTKVFLFLAQT